jgi:hypothetical protein
MMNIRGLILDDSERTVHLPTLQFAARINAGSEVEERTEARHRFFWYMPASSAHEALLLTVYKKIIGEENVWKYMQKQDE